MHPITGIEILVFTMHSGLSNLSIRLWVKSPVGLILLHFFNKPWKSIFYMGESWFCMDSVLEFLLLEKEGFGRDKEKRTLWNRATLAISWVIWLERNRRIFQNRHINPSFLWDRVVFLASLWTKATSFFVGMTLTDIQRENWQLVLSQMFSFLFWDFFLLLGMLCGLLVLSFVSSFIFTNKTFCFLIFFKKNLLSVDTLKKAIG